MDRASRFSRKAGRSPYRAKRDASRWLHMTAQSTRPAPPRSHTLGNTPNRNMYAPPRQLGRLRAPLGRLRAPSKMASCSSRATFRCLRPGGRPGFPGGGLCIAHRQGNGVTSLVFKFWLQSSKGWWRYRASRKAGQGPRFREACVKPFCSRNGRTCARQLWVMLVRNKAGAGGHAPLI